MLDSTATPSISDGPYVSPAISLLTGGSAPSVGETSRSWSANTAWIASRHAVRIAWSRLTSRIVAVVPQSIQRR